MADAFTLRAAFGGPADIVLWVVVALALALLVVARRLLRELVDKDEGTDAMVAAAEVVRDAGRALKRRMRTLVWPVAAVAVALLLVPAPSLTLRLVRSVAVLAGAGLGTLSATVALSVALRADSRAASAARRSLRESFAVVVRAGGLVGLIAAALALLWDAAIMLSFGADAPQVLLGSVAGASLVALGIRTGGGTAAEAAEAGLRLLGPDDGEAGHAPGSRAATPGPGGAHPSGVATEAVIDPAAVLTMAAEGVRGAAGTAAELLAVGELAFLGVLLLVGVGFPGVSASRAALLMLLPLVARATGAWASFVGIVVRTPGGEEEPRTRDLVRGFLLTVIVTAAVIIVATLALTRDPRPLLGLAVGLGLAAAVMAFYGLRDAASRPGEPTGAPRLPVVGPLSGERASTGPASSAFFLLVISAAVVASALIGGEDLGMAVLSLALTAVGMASVSPAAIALGVFAPVARGAGSIGLMAGMLGDRARATLGVLLGEGRSTGVVVDAYLAGSAGLTVVGLLGIALEAGAGPASAAGVIATVAPRLVVGLLVGAVIPLLTGSLTTGTMARCAAEFVVEGRVQRRGGVAGGGARGLARLADLLAQRSVLELGAPGVVAVCGPAGLGFALGAGAMGAAVAGALVTLPLAALVVPRDPLAPGARSPALTPFLEVMAVSSMILAPTVRDASGKPVLETLLTLLSGAAVLAALAWWRGRRPDAPWPELGSAGRG